jgi:hypothetical protein
MDLIVPMAIGEGGRIQRLTIEAIGAELVGEMQRVFTTGSLVRQMGNDQITDPRPHWLEIVTL